MLSKATLTFWTKLEAFCAFQVPAQQYYAHGNPSDFTQTRPNKTHHNSIRADQKRTHNLLQEKGAKRSKSIPEIDWFQKRNCKNATFALFLVLKVVPKVK